MPLIQLPLSHIIETARCRLREPTAADIPYVFSATRYPGFNDGMLWDPPETPDELEGHLARSLQAWAEGKSYLFTIERRTDNRFLGRIVIRPVAGTDRWIIGYWLHPEHQGNGYMRESAAAIISFGFEQLQASQIEACHATWNEPSARVLRSNGMRFVEHLPQGFQKRGQWVAEDRLAISRAAWDAGRSAEA